MADRRLGASALAIPPLVLGGMFRDANGRMNEIERALDYALDQGLHAIDTAPLYGFGDGERLLGRWLRGRRSRVTLLGKVGLRWDGDFGDVLFTANVGGKQRVVRRDSRPRSVRQDVEESLVRLGCEAIDLVQIHQRDPRTPIVDTLGELGRLRTEGKIRAVGISNFTWPELLEAERGLGGHGLASTQNLYNLLQREAEEDILPGARERNVGFLAYSPLARGLLAGRAGERSAPLTDGRQSEPLFQAGNRRRVNAALDTVLAPIARAAGAPVAAVALAWLIARPGVTAAIVGAQNVAQVEAALAAGRVVLTAEHRCEIDRRFQALPLDRQEGIPVHRRLTERLRRLKRRLQRLRDGRGRPS